MKNWILLLAVFSALNVHSGQETDQCYDLFLYHGKSQKDYENGGSKNHGRTNPYTYIGSITGWAMENGVRITYRGNEQRVVNMSGGAPCETWPTNLDEWRFRVGATTYSGVVHDNQFNTDPNKRWNTNCVQKSDAGLGDDTYAAAGVIAVRRNLDGYQRSTFPSKMLAEHTRLGVSSYFQGWLDEDQVWDAVPGVLGNIASCAQDVVVTPVYNNKDYVDGILNAENLSLQVTVLLDKAGSCGSDQGSCSGFTPVGGFGFGNDCISSRFYIGQSQWIQLMVQTPVLDLRNPAVLWIPEGEAIGIHKDVNNQIDQIYTGTHLTVITPLQTSGTISTEYKVEVFEAVNAYDDQQPDYLHVLDTSPVALSTMEVERVDALGEEVRVKNDRDGRVDDLLYEWETTIESVSGRDGWTMTRGLNGGAQTVERKTERTYTNAGVEYLEVIDWVLDPTNTTNYLSRTEKVYRNFPTPSVSVTNVVGWNGSGPILDISTQDPVDDWRLETTIEGFNGKTETTTMAYYTAADGAGKEGRLKSAQYPDGNWMTRDYDAQGRVTKEVSSYKNNAFGTAENLNRVTEYDYTALGTDPGTNTTTPRTVTRKVAGQIVGKTFTLLLSGETQNIQAESPTAAWNNAANLVTTQYFDNGELVVTEMPDGQIRTSRTTYVGDQEIVTTATGKPDVLPVTKNSTVIKGYKTVTTSHEILGYLVSSYRYRVESGGDILLTGQVDSDLDDEFRAQRTDYVDGTFTTREYECCGLRKMTDKQGILTEFDRDQLRRVIRSTRSSVTSHTEYDGLGRTTFTYMTPSNDYNDIYGKATARPEYNEIQELEKTYDPVGRETEYDRSVASGIITRTTTYPGGSTSITKTYADGTPIETLGTATRPMTTTISWDTNGQRITEQAYASNTNDYTKTTTDFLGRTIKTERPSPTGTGIASTQTNYEAGTSRMIERLDEASLRTIYQYNDLSELEVTAIDVNNNGQVELGGSDQVTSNVVEYVDYTFNNTTYPTRKTSSYVWQEENSATSTLISESWSTHDGLHRWSESFGQLTHSETLRDVPNAKVTTTRTSPDDSYVVSITEDGLAQSTTTYDANDVQLTQMTYGYDQWNRRNTLTDAGTGTTTTTFHADGSVNTVTTPDPDGTGPLTAQVTTTWSSGLNSLGYTGTGGRIAKVTTPDNKTVTREYFPTGELQKQEGARQYPVEYTFDYAGRMKTMKTWQDKLGNAGIATTTWNYNDAGVMTSKRYDDNKGPDYEYDVRGLLEKRTWARGKVTEYGYDSRRRLETIDYPSSTTSSVTNRYDRVGRMIEVEDASGTRTYDHGTEFLLEQEEYTAGLLNGWEIGRGYDLLRRPDEVELLESSTSKHKVEYGYTDASWLETVTGHSLTNEYSYVTNRTVLDELDQGGVQTVDRDWDNLNRLTQIETDNGTVTLSSHAYEYNNANQRTKATLDGGNYWEYDYDDLGQVISGVKKNSGGTALNGYTFGYTFDDIGNRKTATENGNTTDYTPNLLNQYTEIDRPAFADLRGDRANTNTTIDVDLLGDGNPAVQADYNVLLWHKTIAITDLVSEFEITATENGNSNSTTGSLHTPNGAEVPQYDDDGNLTRDHLWTYTWNSENRLVVQEHRSDVTLTPLSRKKMEYLYDSQGRRMQRKTYEEVSSSWVLQEDVRFVYDGWNLLAEIDANGDIVRDYVWGMDVSGSMQGAGGVEGLLSVDDGTTVGLAVYDGNGNVMGYSDSSTGNLVAEYEYDPFGRTILSLGTQVDAFSYRFSTKYQDEESGYYYYGFRYYDPEIGRWFNRDPIREVGGTNVYGFVGNDGLRMFDLLGLAWQIARSKDEKWAIAKPQNSNDSFEDLANLIKLNYSERSKWLKTSNRNFQFVEEEDSASTDCEYKIPNLMVVFTTPMESGPGFDFALTGNVMRRRAKRKGRDYAENNFKVLYLDSITSSGLFVRSWELDGIYAYSFGGHSGSDETYTKWFGYQIGDDHIPPTSVNPPYKLAGIYAYACATADLNIDTDQDYVVDPILGLMPVAESWKVHLSDNGNFVGYSGPVTVWHEPAE